MAKSSAPTFGFDNITDEQAMAPRAGRGTAIPQPLLDAIKTRAFKAVVVQDLATAKTTRELIRRAAQSLGMGSDTSQEVLSDNTVKVYFQGRDRRTYGADNGDNGDQGDQGDNGDQG
jgi:hypothetical protein